MNKTIHNQHGRDKENIFLYINSKNPIQKAHWHLETLDLGSNGLDRVRGRPDRYSSKNWRPDYPQFEI
jgi:hypothetical protein